MEEVRYSWKQMPFIYNASYYNVKDYIEGRKFIVIDNRTGREYQFPQNEANFDYYRRYYQLEEPIIFDRDLWNEDFVGWAISTTKDFIENVDRKFLTQSLTPRVLNYVVNNFEFRQIFATLQYMTSHMTSDLWNKALQRNNEVIYYVPEEYVTPKILTETLGNIKNCSFFFYAANHHYQDTKYLTPELFTKIYFNCDTEYKLKLIPSRRWSNHSWEGKLIEKLITQEVADDILSLDITTICNVPPQFVSRENAIKAMNYSPRFICYVPAEYQTPDRQQKAVDFDLINISSIDPSVLTEEIIYYVLNKKPHFIQYVPKERKTVELCEYAVNLNSQALKTVPPKLRTVEICFNAVTKDPSVITYVPVEFMTEEFLSNLSNAGVVIPLSCRGYVKESLMANQKLQEEQQKLHEKRLEFEKIALSESKFEINEETMNIRLESLPELLTGRALKLLRNNNILTVGDLLNVSQNVGFYEKLLDDTKITYIEIRAALRLLKCKYMGVDPMINQEEDNGYSELENKLGLSTNAITSLQRCGYTTTKTFFELINNELIDPKTNKMINVGAEIAQELMFKGTIVTQFYANKKAKEESATEDETIELLSEELTQIRNEIQRLNARSDEIIAKIQEKMLEKNKGGILK